MAMLPEHIITVAARSLGTPYIWGGDTPAGYDCSGYVLAMLRDAGCGPLSGSPRTAEQIRQACTVVPWDQVQPGDLLFVDYPADRVDPVAADGHAATHVAFSLGDDSGRVLSAQEPTVREVVIAGNPWWQGTDTTGLFEARRHPTVPATPLPTTADLALGFTRVWPVIQQYAQLYGADAAVMAGIGDQESGGFVNRLVHDDGHGRGLFGLDDRYGLLDFERWCGMVWVDTQHAGSIAPVLQIEYLAKWLSENTPTYGSAMNAARVWHTGPGGWETAEGNYYEQLVRSKARVLGLVI